MTAEPNSQDKRSRRASLEDVGRRLDEEVERLIAYLNDEVVPSVRNHSSRAIRTAAQKLEDFAQYLDEHRKARGEKDYKDPGAGI